MGRFGCRILSEKISWIDFLVWSNEMKSTKSFEGLINHFGISFKSDWYKLWSIVANWLNDISDQTDESVRVVAERTNYLINGSVILPFRSLINRHCGCWQILASPLVMNRDLSISTSGLAPALDKKISLLWVALRLSTLGKETLVLSWMRHSGSPRFLSSPLHFSNENIDFGYARTISFNRGIRTCQSLFLPLQSKWRFLCFGESTSSLLFHLAHNRIIIWYTS